MKKIKKTISSINQPVKYEPPFPGKIVRMAWRPFPVNDPLNKLPKNNFSESAIEDVKIYYTNQLLKLRECGFNLIRYVPSEQWIAKYDTATDPINYKDIWLFECMYRMDQREVVNWKATSMKVVVSEGALLNNIRKSINTTQFQVNTDIKTTGAYKFAKMNKDNPFLYAYEPKDEPKWVDWHYEVNQLYTNSWFLKNVYQAIVAAQQENGEAHMIYDNLAVPRFEHTHANKDDGWFPGNYYYNQFLFAYDTAFPPSLWSYDYYPTLISSSDSAVDIQTKYKRFYRWLNFFLKQSRASNYSVPFWAFCVCAEWHKETDEITVQTPYPSLEIMRWQAFTSLAFGAQGIVYYYYSAYGENDLTDNEDSVRDPNTVTCPYLEKTKGNWIYTPVWDLVKELNQEIIRYEHVFAGCRVVDVRFAKNNTNSNNNSETGSADSSANKLINSDIGTGPQELEPPLPLEESYYEVPDFSGAMGPLVDISVGNQGVLISHLETPASDGTIDEYLVFVNKSYTNRQPVCLTLDLESYICYLYENMLPVNPDSHFKVSKGVDEQPYFILEAGGFRILHFQKNPKPTI